jgi:alkylhydroperoxidase family enzyme
MIATAPDHPSTHRLEHPNEPHARIAPIPSTEFHADWLATLARIPGDGLKGAGFPRNVLGTIAHDPETFGPFLEYWVSCKSRFSLTVREQELVILRMACLYGSNYVWKHHVPVAREFGISEAEIAAVMPSDRTASRRCSRSPTNSSRSAPSVVRPGMRTRVTSTGAISSI